MKKLLCICQLLLMLCVAVRLHADENILRNGDFENITGGLPHMWSTDIYGEDHAGVGFYVESQGAYSGNNYVTIENIRPNDSKLTQYLAVKPNTIYKFSCWIKAEGTSDKALGANITVLDILETSRDFKDTEGNWEYVEFYGRTDKKQRHLTVTARLGGYGNLNIGKASFDDYKVEQVSTTPAGVKVINLFREKSKDVEQQRLSAVTFISLPAVVIYCFLFIGLFIVAYNIISRETELQKTEGKRAILVFYLLLSAGWILRIIISPVIEGYPTDILCFKAWSNVAATQGLANFYTSDMFVDYPPVYIYILYLIGYVRNLFSLGFNSDVFLILLKSPAILADIVSSAIIFQLSKKKLGVVIAATLSLLYVFNPAIICNSTVYGQIDSFFTLFVLLMLVFVYKDKLEIASIIFVLAVLIKPQALIFTPIGIYALIQKRSLKTACLSLLYMALAFIIIIFPFSIKQNLFWIFELYSKTLSSYPFAAVNAFNLFAFFGGNGANVNETFFIFSYKVWGGIFTVALVGYLTLLYFVSKHKSKPFFTAMFVTAAFFVLSHKMHERYIFPVIALALMSYIYTNDKRLLFLFAGFSITAFLNQVLLIDMVLTRELFWFPADDTKLRAISMLNVALLIYTIKLSIDIYIKNRVKPVTPLLSKSTKDKHETIKHQPLKSLSLTEARQISFSKRDYIIISSLTLVYAAVALFNLGSLKAPQSFWKPMNSGESFYIDLGESKNIDRINYFLGLGEGSYKLEFSQDAETWGDENGVQQENKFGIVGWKYITVNLNARYVKITSEKPGLMLNEMGFFITNSTQPIPIKSIVEVYSGSGPPSCGKSQNVFDEQETIAYLPSFINSMYFDEIYHARTAYEHLHGLEPTETTHPPLGKVFISLGIAAFGMTPFGWRIMGTLFGIAMVPIMYLFGKRIFKKTEYAFITSFLFTFDFMHFTQTRISTVDVYAVFFIILMYYYMHQYFNMNFFNNNFKSTLLPLLLSGIFFGLGAATKWYTLYGGLGLAVIFFTSLVQRFYEYKKAKERTTLKKHKIDARKRKEDKVIVQLFYRYAALTLLWCLLAFVLIPVIIYVLSYMPLKMIPGQSYGLSDIFASQKHMYRYHSQLQATHPFSSAWWQWPIIRKPVWAYTGQQELPADRISSIVIMGNPAVWWIGSLAIIMALVTAFCKKEKAMFVVLVAVASQYLPWMIGARKLLFIYHFFATVPFMVLCITYVLKVLREKFSKFKYITYVYLAVILVLFIMFYPILSGMVISKSFAATYLRWFKSWVFFQ